jgi:Flp pilus assembly protein TadG
MKTDLTRSGLDQTAHRGMEGAEVASATVGEHAQARNWRSRLRHLLFSEEEGTQLVEMAFVAPIMMLMLTGLASFGMALYSYQQLGYAVATAAEEVGAAQGVTVSDPCAQIESIVTSLLPNWSVSKFTYTVAITSPSGTTTTPATTGSGFSCASDESDMTMGYPMRVTVSYQYNWFSVFTWRPDNSFTPSGNLTVSESVLVQ